MRGGSHSAAATSANWAYGHGTPRPHLPRHRLQVMPTSVVASFLLLDFAEARSIAYIEYRNGAVYVQDQQEVEVYNLIAAMT